MFTYINTHALGLTTAVETIVNMSDSPMALQF